MISKVWNVVVDPNRKVCHRRVATILITNQNSAEGAPGPSLLGTGETAGCPKSRFWGLGYL